MEGDEGPFKCHSDQDDLIPLKHKSQESKHIYSPSLGWYPNSKATGFFCLFAPNVTSLMTLQHEMQVEGRKGLCFGLFEDARIKQHVFIKCQRMLLTKGKNASRRSRKHRKELAL